MALALEQFVKNLEDSGILASDTIKDFIPPKASPKDAEDLARELVRKKKLTKFQAEEVYRGRGKSLFLGGYTLLDKIGAGGSPRPLFQEIFVNNVFGVGAECSAVWLAAAEMSKTRERKRCCGLHQCSENRCRELHRLERQMVSETPPSFSVGKRLGNRNESAPIRASFAALPESISEMKRCLFMSERFNARNLELFHEVVSGDVLAA